MVKSLFVIAVSLLTSLGVYAQKKSQGYYISLTADTVTGFFKQFEEWSLTPKKVKFETSTSGSIELTPANCKSFTVTGFDTYDAMDVTRMINPNIFKADLTETNRTDTFENIKAFLHLHNNNNELKLYGYKDNRRENFFIKKGDDILTELKFKIYLVDRNVVEDKQYIVQLRSLFAPVITKDKKLGYLLDKLQYNEEDIITFLNRVQGTSPQKGIKKYPSEFIIIGGASLNSFKVTPYSIYIPPTTIKYNSQVSPLIGISIANYSQRNFGKNMFAFQLKYYNFKHSSIYSFNGGSAQAEYEYKAHVVTAGLNIGRKWIRQKNFSWYTSLVPEGLFLINNTETTNLTGSRSTVVNGRKIGITVGLQSGFIFKKSGIWALYNFNGLNTQNNIYYQTTHRSMQVGVDWRFRL